MQNNFIANSEHQEAAKSGFYSQHLAAVSNKGNSAFTTDDVFNEHGALLIKKGVHIDTNIRDKLLQHKLLKPLDHLVGLEKQVNTQTLRTRFNQLMNDYPDVREINKTLRFESEFEKLLNTNYLHPIITQKLTVLNSQFSSEFDKCMFNAWLSTITARELDLSQTDIKNTFITSMLHDIGMMHLDPDIVNSNRQLTPDEWKTIQAHVIIGKLITDAIPDLSPDVSRAVVEHHETCFGSGYPFSISGYERGVIGRIIGMSDSIHAIRVNNFVKEKRTLGDIQPFLQLNSITQSNDVYCAMMSIFKKSKLKRTRICPVNNPNTYAKQVGQQVRIMSDSKSALDNVYTGLNEQHFANRNDKNTSSILAILRRMLTTITESGLLSTELVVWLNQASTEMDIDDIVLDEINEVDLLISELTWQMRNTLRMLSAHYDKLRDKNKSVGDPIATSIETIKENLDQLQALQPIN